MKKIFGILLLIGASVFTGCSSMSPHSSRVPAGDTMTKENYQEHFCDKFSTIEWQVISTLLKEMEQSPYPVDGYFQPAACQPGGYSAAVKSPIAHIIADSPAKRVKFLDILWLYYTKRRNEPTKFTDLVNAKNTEGETLLDYIESMKKRGNYSLPETQEAVARIVLVACSHGAVYSAYPEKSCPE